MNFTRFILSLMVIAGTFSFTASAQGTFSQIYQIMQTRCSASTCHGAYTQTFDVTVSETALYDSLVNKTPMNTAAAAKGYKRVDPGYVDRSFLLRKIAHGISAPLTLDTATEGGNMPLDTAKLHDNEIELVRQWILFGAPRTAIVADTAVINRYYREGGIDDTYPDHEAPAPGQGFQIYIGRIFMAADTEAYYYIKHDPRLLNDIEIPKVVTLLPSTAHHFVIYKFFPGGQDNYREGIRFEHESSHPDVSDGIGTGNNKWEYELPAGTAYYWEAGTVLDLNLHIFNYHPDSILSCELYINIYTQPLGTADDYMLIRNFPVETIMIPQDGQLHTDVQIANDPDETHTWKIWQLYSHTHKYGKDYDIFLRNGDGTKGEQVYEGWWSYEEGYNVGFYRNGVDATFRYYPDDGLLEVDPHQGFIHEATWENTDGPNPIFWGLTSADEMMVMGFQYVQGNLLTGINEHKDLVNNVKIYPNPSSGEFTVKFPVKTTATVEMELIGMMGEKVATLMNETIPAGDHSQKINASDFNLSDGVYFIRTTINGNTSTSKLTVLGR